MITLVTEALEDHSNNGYRWITLCTRKCSPLMITPIDNTLINADISVKNVIGFKIACLPDEGTTRILIDHYTSRVYGVFVCVVDNNSFIARQSTSVKIYRIFVYI